MAKKENKEELDLEMNLDANLQAEEEMHTYNEDDYEDEDDLEFDFDEFKSDEEEQEEEQEEEEENEEGNDDILNDDEEETTEFSKKEIEAFNKKAGTEFKTSEDLKNFLSGKEEENEEENEQKEFDQANQTFKFYSQYLDTSKFNDEALMRSYFQSEAVKEKKDVNSDEVQIEIEEKITDLVDKGTLALTAKDLRRDIKAIADKAKGIVDGIQNKRDVAKKEATKKDAELLKNSFLGLYKKENFYGVQIKEDDLKEVFKQTKSGEFLEMISKDKALLAELAMMHKYRNVINKNASGPGYDEGVKSVLDEFEEKKDTSASTQRARKSGSSEGSKSASLLADLLTEDKVEDED